MTDSNPYVPPTKNVETDAMGEYADIKLLSADGRLGRLRYFAYSFGLLIAIYLAIGILAGVASILPETAMMIVMGLVGLVGGGAMIYISFVLMIQRLHDTNNTGWFSLVMFIPLISILFTLYLWFMPGTQGSNKYGNPPPPNKTVLLLVAVIAIIFFVGIIAAIAIPAYNDYLEAARVSAQ